VPSTQQPRRCSLPEGGGGASQAAQRGRWAAWSRHLRAFTRLARPSRRRSAAAGTFDADVVLARLVEWSQAHGGPPRAYDWDPPLAHAMGLATGGCERWERDHPHWPGHATVVRYFGSWAHALHAAGLAPPAPDCELPLGERIAAARRLRREGLAKSAIADALGVSPRTGQLPGLPAVHRVRDAGGQVEFGAMPEVSGGRAARGAVGSG